LSTNGNLTPVADNESAVPTRLALPRERHSLTHKFEIAGHEGYVIVGFYVARWLALRFLTQEERELHGIRVVDQT
jgi:ribonucleoside-diphosphate reductase alpha chain